MYQTRYGAWRAGTTRYNATRSNSNQNMGSGTAPGAGHSMSNGRRLGRNLFTHYKMAEEELQAICLKYKPVPKNAKLALWWSDEHGLPCNGGTRDVKPAKPGLRQKIEKILPLELCRSGILHATRSLGVWHGRRLWLVALRGQIVEDENKLGALDREFIGEIKNVL